MSETAKGQAWRKHCVYSKEYSEGYDKIDWGKSSNDEQVSQCDSSVLTQESLKIWKERELLKKLRGDPNILENQDINKPTK